MQSSAGPSVYPGDDIDNRSRNAKAQRRHREKRKAHLKALEESVQVLTSQLDETRRQLSAYAVSAPPRFSPGAKDQMVAENAYLRGENADLRRQLYAIRGTAYPSSSHGFDGEHEGVKEGHQWSDIKHEGGYGPYPVSASPLRQSVGHGRNLSHSGDFMREPGESTSGPSSGSSYPNQVDHFGVPIPTQRTSTASSTRSRLFSTSAPSASPYVQSAAFPSDTRSHPHPQHAPPPPSHAMDPRYPPAVRYESAVYPQQPPPHSMPRSSNMPYHSPVDSYGRSDGEVPWNSESGPPPFQAPPPVYAMGYQQSADGGAPPAEWRQDTH